MKKIIVFSILAMIAFTACQTIEEPIKEDSTVFTAIVEDGFSGDTKTSLDGSGNVLWKLGDQVSVFAASTVNEQYQVSDASDGKTTATLNKIPAGGFVAGTEIDNNVAFYPYASTAEIAKSVSNYVISEIELPATQTYVTGSFGNGAFPMAAVTSSTEDNNFKFKNVLGGLKLQLKGTATITSITVTGNNNEILCGDAEVTTAYGGVPSIVLSDASAKTVTLNCGAGVTLDSETATSFIIALPPMTMTGGFTVVVTDSESKQMEITTSKSQTITRSNLLKMPAVNYVGTAQAAPLKFTSNGATSISLTKTGTLDAISLEYQVNDGPWSSYTIGDIVALADGEYVSFRAGAGGNAMFSFYDRYYSFNMTGGGTIVASGSVMSLLNQSESTDLSPTCSFSHLFYNCTRLITAPELPATTLTNFCYYSMFEGCTNIMVAPELPATTLKPGCYEKMFYGCISLATAPTLPATSLADECYRRMFSGCTSLTTATVLPATTLAEDCYFEMFADCPNLAAAPELPATTLAEGCYMQMFAGTNLTTAPELPATILENKCYYGMFSGCTNLTTAPALPATSLAECCYEYMFSHCISLATAPELPATTLADYCYMNMFMNCTNLTTAPDLPANTLVEGCYEQMFYGCSKLNYVKALFTTDPLSVSYSTTDWLYGVSGSGTFVKSGSASWDVTGTNGVPSGWTVMTTVPIPDAVDLGLPSGIKWASFNIGASAPEEYGGYYAWGETETKTRYEEQTYKWCNGEIFDLKMTKYCISDYYGTIVDNKTVLEPEDDVAHVKLQGKWRMPTDEEWTELKTKCTWTWTDDYNGTGVGGVIMAATNGNSIFLPAAGNMSSDYNYYPGKVGYYWSSSITTSPYNSDAKDFMFQSTGPYCSSFNRYYGHPVRPVCD